VLYSRTTKSERHILRVLALLTPLFDARRTDLTPSEFWTPGTYFTHPRRSKALLLNLVPARPLSRPAQVVLGREAAHLLESRTGLILDWAGGVSKNRSKVVIVVKTLAGDARTGRNRELWAEPRDLAAVARLVPGRGRERPGERGR